MSLQKFVVDVVEAMGGVVIPTEYALCEIVVPEEFSELFQGKTELILAFDFEVAEENPQAEFVTFGSYIFEQLMEFVRQRAVSSLRFVEVNSLSLHDPLGKIKRFLSHEQGKITLLNKRKRMGAWVSFAFRTAYVSDEKEEEFREIWVNLADHTLDSDMQSEQYSFIYHEHLSDHYPMTTVPDLTEALKLAYRKIHEEAEQVKGERQRDEEMEMEIKRIREYYTALAAETVKRTERKGLSDQKKQELHVKAKSIELEKEKQIQELRGKYTVTTEITLDHSVLYIVPLLEYDVQIDFRNESNTRLIHYNPLLKRFSIINHLEPVHV